LLTFRAGRGLFEHGNHIDDWFGDRSGDLQLHLAMLLAREPTASVTRTKPGQRASFASSPATGVSRSFATQLSRAPADIVTELRLAMLLARGASSERSRGARFASLLATGVSRFLPINPSPVIVSEVLLPLFAQPERAPGRPAEEQEERTAFWHGREGVDDMKQLDLEHSVN